MTAAMSQWAECRLAARERSRQRTIGNLLHSAADHLPQGANVYFAARLRPGPWLLNMVAWTTIVAALGISFSGDYQWYKPLFLLVPVVAGQSTSLLLTAIVASSDGVTLHRARYTTIGHAIAEVSFSDVRRELRTSRRGRQRSVWIVNGKRYMTVSRVEEQPMEQILLMCERELSR